MKLTTLRLCRLFQFRVDIWRQLCTLPRWIDSDVLVQVINLWTHLEYHNPQVTHAQMSLQFAEFCCLCTGDFSVSYRGTCVQHYAVIHSLKDGYTWNSHHQIKTESTSRLSNKVPIIIPPDLFSTKSFFNNTLEFSITSNFQSTRLDQIVTPPRALQQQWKIYRQSRFCIHVWSEIKPMCSSGRFFILFLNQGLGLNCRRERIRIYMNSHQVWFSVTSKEWKPIRQRQEKIFPEEALRSYGFQMAHMKCWWSGWGFIDDDVAWAPLFTDGCRWMWHRIHPTHSLA